MIYAVTDLRRRILRPDSKRTNPTVSETIVIIRIITAAATVSSIIRNCDTTVPQKLKSM